jgi:hypothetical protein
MNHWILLILTTLVLQVSCARHSDEEILLTGRVVQAVDTTRACAGIDILLVKASNNAVLAKTFSDRNGCFNFKRRDLINVSGKAEYNILGCSFAGVDTAVLKQNISGKTILNGAAMLRLIKGD